MSESRTVIVAGAGIAGLTTALTLAQRGYRIVVLEQAGRLEETGAGVQLSPNATRVLAGLGLEERLRTEVVAPAAIEIKTARGRKLASVPLGEAAAERYGAPYWVIHRGDLQTALVEAVSAHPDIKLQLGTRCEDFVVHANGVSVACRQGAIAADEQGIALVGADGLWSSFRNRLGNDAAPAFRHRTAWRALLPAESVPPALREPVVHLWLGDDAHVVHYPVKAGAMINVVAIVGDAAAKPGWSEQGARADLMARFSRWRWSSDLRALIALPEEWLTFALYDLRPLRRWGRGPVTLVGDAAHPTLPFLAQGAALAIEDAAVLASSLGRTPDDPAKAMRRYERARRRRTAKVQRAARRNGSVYHLAGAEALIRNLYLRTLGGNRLRRRYDWLYDWKPLPPRP